MSGSDKKDYEVGYGKPPKKSQFKPGQSGNPKGRPKRKRKAQADIAKFFSKRVRLSINGEPKRLPILEVGLRQLAKQAAEGDLKAIREMMRLYERHCGPVLDEGETATQAPADIQSAQIGSIFLGDALLGLGLAYRESSGELLYREPLEAALTALGRSFSDLPENVQQLIGKDRPEPGDPIAPTSMELMAQAVADGRMSRS